jgi:putative membrane-bound dehydrogenase-like protein
MRPFAFAAIVAAALTASLHAGDGNRLAYLDGNDPFYPTRIFPKLTTPMWVGEEGVEAVVILSIDDMRGHEKWETFLRPIIARLKKVDGRAPISIMTNRIDPDEPHLKEWLKEGLSLETHTYDHPCPLLQGGNFEKAKQTYDRCVDQMFAVPGSKPVAFRMPCCDSLNSVSPRFFAEIFNKVTEKGNFLTIDSSVFNLTTANDPDLPRELVIDKDGQDRFLKYVPTDRTWVGTIENYPYPYVIGKLCWEFPCAMPSDWQANHLFKKNADPRLTEDWKAMLDCMVIKQGVMPVVFHPHGWSKPEQFVELIDYAVKKHGKKVKFLTFKECQERLNKNVLGGQVLRAAKSGQDMGIRLYDVNSDGFIDAVISTDEGKEGRIWLPTEKVWKVANAVLDEPRPILPAKLPAARFHPDGSDAGLRFVDIDEDGYDDVIFSNEKEYGLYLFDPAKKGWTRKVFHGKQGDGKALPPFTIKGKNNGAWFHSRHLYVQNESTALLKDLVDRRSYNELLAGVEPTAKSPAAALKAIKTRPGFVVEEMVCEPLVQDPIAMSWGPDGKLWVVEMGDYPLGVDGKGKPGGKVLCLESTKDNGKYDKVTTFLDKLPFPTNVLPWRKGVLITCAPDILYAEDTDGDGKADKIVKLYSGFTEGNQQHRVNSLVWGLDNWIYCANGDSGGSVKSVKKGTTVNISGRDLRIRPDTGDIDLQAGQTQYGRSRNDWGDWFGCNNSNPMYHFALADHYIRRNPHVAAPDPRVQISEKPGAAEVFPISRTLPRFNSPEGANHFTSACSCIVYRDDLFGPLFSNSTFVSEPVHNLVHREIIEPNGVTFKSRRAPDEQTSEFLASSDNWFRPTSLATGPDGALWIADMYRHVIEHPQWIPSDWQKRLDLRAGHDMGRIYRVYPAGVKPRAIPRLDRMTTAELVAALDSPSGWQRDMAQMMLIWKADKEAVPLLEKQVKESKRPLCRLHSLCTLDGLDALTKEMVKIGLKDEHPGVRRHAVRLCEARLDPSFGIDLVRLVEDKDAQVRMQLAYTLGEWDDPIASSMLAAVAVESNGDRFLLAAAMSSVNKKNLDGVLKAVMEARRDAPPPAALIENLLRLASALNHTKALVTLLDAVGSAKDGKYTPWHFTALAGLLDALDQRGLTLAKLRDQDPELKQAVTKLGDLFKAARSTLADKASNNDDKRQAMLLVGRGLEMQKEEVTLLGGFLSPQSPDDLQSAAIASLGRIKGDAVPAELLRNWKGYSPKTRNAVLDVLLRRDDWLKATLDALEKKAIAPSEVDSPRRQRLLEHRDAAVRARVTKLFAGLVNADRQKVIDSYADVLTLQGDATKGLAIFTKNCAACHKLGDVGNVVGPDLASVADKSSQGLLIAVLDPNRAVEARYVNYSAITRAGLTITGILASETGNSITLLGQDGKPQVILRKDLDELTSTGKSLMPEGLEKEIKPQEMADLFAFVRSVGPQVKPKVFKGNKPELVKAKGGVLLLTAKNAEIYGKNLVFEEKNENLGYWDTDDGQAIWTVDVPKSGRYSVVVHYSCVKESAGKSFVLQAGSNQLTGKVTSTGSWDTFQEMEAGSIVLSAGQQRLSMRPAGRLVGTAMLDLKAIKLVPVKE